MRDRTREPLLGRKPAWVERWEQRQQGRFDRQEVDARERGQREVAVVGPGGGSYTVRAVPKGETLRDWEPSAFADVGVVGLVLVVAFLAVKTAVVEVRLRSSDGWTVGVVHNGPMHVKVVHREWVAEKREATARVRELAARVEAGDFDRVRGWRHTERGQ